MGDRPVKLVSWWHWAGATVAVAAGSSMPLYREHRDAGAVRTSSLVISAITFCLGFAIMAGVFLYANRPESKDKPSATGAASRG